MLRSVLEAKKAAAHAIFQSRAVKVDAQKGFKLKAHERFPEAPRSPIYVRMRSKGTKDGRLSQADITTISEAMAVYILLHGLLSEANFICGIPAAGEPFVDGIMSFVDNLNLARMYLEKEEGGGKRRITGIREDSLFLIPAGQGCLLIDDLVTGADTKLEAIAAIQRQGVDVTNLLVFLDRSTDAKAILAKHGVSLHALWQSEEFLNFAVDNNYLSVADKEKIISYPVALNAYIEMNS
jgi:orotate phosphoribosyltransferase